MVGWDPNYFQKEDEEKLEALGYKQQLLRNLTPLNNIGISFSCIGAPATVVGLFAYSLAIGGPATMVISWVVVSVFSFCVALSMAEIVSAMPISGGPYSWAAVLAPAKHSAFASWITAWFNLLGLAALNTTIAYALAGLISTAAVVKTDYVSSPGGNIGLCAAILVSWAVLNTIGRRLLRYILYTSLVANTFGVVAFIIAVLAKAPSYQPASFVFGSFIDTTGTDGSEGWAIRASPAYVACIGGVMGLSNFIGYDASAHISEETRRASLIAPLGIVISVALSAIFGFALILALLFSIQDFDAILLSTCGQPVLANLIDIFGENGALVLFTLPMLICWYCGLFLTMSSSRVTWAFSRDRGIPEYISKIDEKSMTPLRAVIFCSTFSFILTLPSLGSVVTLVAVSSIASMGLLISYGIPISLKLIYYDEFCSKRGPFNLGFASRPLALVSILWVLFASVVLCLPTSTPITSQTLNYAPIAAVVTLLWAIGFWLLKGSRSFHGPVLARPMPSDTGHLMVELKY